MGSKGQTKSESLFERARQVLVGGVNSPVRAFHAVGGVPVYFRRGKGSRLYDEDGRAYLDFCLSWGPLILGHAHPEVTRAAGKALEKGSSFGACNEAEVLLAEEVARVIPSMERLRLTSSGTEAVMSALRLARAFTGRDRIVKFSGCYHGHADSLLVQAGSGAATLGVPDSAGVPRAWAESTLSLPYNDVESFRGAFRKTGPEIAAVIVEPVAANMGVVPPEPGFLETLREVTRENGSLLIFDEVVTGFRLCYGGCQSLCAIQPDLTCLGKIIGGGFPVGAFGGRLDIMEKLSPVGPVYQAGTLSGNPVAAAAGLAALRALREEKPYLGLERSAAGFVDEVRDLARREGVSVQVQRAGSMFTVFFTDRAVSDYASAKTSDTARYARFFHALLREGVYFPPAQFEAAFLSTAHIPRDLERALKAVRKALKAAGHPSYIFSGVDTPRSPKPSRSTHRTPSHRASLASVNSRSEPPTTRCFS